MRKIFDPGGANEEKTIFVYDSGQIALQFHDEGSGDLGAEDLTNRYFWGPAVDQILADEQVHWDAGQQEYVTDELLWPLGDHLGSVRDVIDGSGTVKIHRVYDAFGNFTEDPATASHLFAFTARPFDAATGLQNNLHRWYDAQVGRWLSEDPIGFTAGDPMEVDPNQYRYCANNPVLFVDPSGLFTVDGPRGYKRSGGPQAALGGAFTFYRQFGDGPYLIQDVVVTGTLVCDTSDGSYNVVGFRYSWTEVWPFGYYGKVRDTHLNRPKDAIDFLKKHCACPCDLKKTWWFTSTAEFVAYAGMISPATGFAVTPVDASTTYRCAEANDEGTTIQGEDAIMSMYPGEESRDPTAPTPLSRKTLTRVGVPGYDTDTWVCSGGTCDYTSTGYHPRHTPGR